MSSRPLSSIPGRLSPGTVHVWFLDHAGPAEPRWLEILDDDERERAMRFRTPQQQDAFAASHALVRTALSAYASLSPEEWRFAISPDGCPSVLGACELTFSLTHAGPRAAVAIATGQAIGLDLEPIRPERDPMTLARRFFGSPESAWLDGLSPAERPAGFAVLWTVKEAALKARGCGLTEPLHSVEVDMDSSGRPVQVRAPGGPWTVRSWSPEPGWCAALVVRGEALTVSTFRARPLGPPVRAPEMGPDRSIA